jgi:hypothetical protein
MSIEFSCLCGEIKASIACDPIDQVYCHCDDCQAVFGGAYVGLALYPTESVKILKGTPTIWACKTNPRRLCKKCGTIVFTQPEGASFRGVNKNLLPENVFKPSSHIYCQYSVLPVVDNLPHYKALPAAFGGSDETMDW